MSRTNPFGFFVLAIAMACAVGGGACKGGATSDDAASDAAVLRDAAVAPDSFAGDAAALLDGSSGDALSCLQATDCPCFANDDCPPAMHCHSEDNTGEHVYCIPGARGSGAAGAPCTGEDDCASALCVDSDQVGKLCSMICTGPEVCPLALPRCLYIGFGVNRSICAPAG